MNITTQPPITAEERPIHSEGWDAFLTAEKQHENPYTGDDQAREHWLWHQGWLDAQAVCGHPHLVEDKSSRLVDVVASAAACVALVLLTAYTQWSDAQFAQAEPPQRHAVVQSELTEDEVIERQVQAYQEGFTEGRLGALIAMGGRP